MAKGHVVGKWGIVVTHAARSNKNRRSGQDQFRTGKRQHCEKWCRFEQPQFFAYTGCERLPPANDKNEPSAAAQPSTSEEETAVVDTSPQISDTPLLEAQPAGPPRPKEGEEQEPETKAVPKALPRTLTNYEGRQIEAHLIHFEDGSLVRDGKVQIKRASDGETFCYPLEQLCQEDQEWINAQSRLAPGTIVTWTGEYESFSVMAKQGEEGVEVKLVFTLTEKQGEFCEGQYFSVTPKEESKPDYRVARVTGTYVGERECPVLWTSFEYGFPSTEAKWATLPHLANAAIEKVR